MTRQRKKSIHLVAAARPNFMKIAPLYQALSNEIWAEVVIIHTGQHYDFNMSEAFFRELELPEPHVHLGVGSGTHSEQTGNVMIAYEKILMNNPPDLIVVVGDVNSTMAVTLTAVKMGVRVAHLEAGLRSFDRSMPEEINRIVTDALADLLWTHSPDGDDNLANEGIPNKKIKRVGNIMIDSLEMMRKRIEQTKIFNDFGLQSGCYGLVTLHRPSNVDDPQTLEYLCRTLTRISKKIPLIFPVHPRTRKNLDLYGMMAYLEKGKHLKTTEPLSYIPFMNLLFNSAFVITDSGGIQEETTYLGIPCLTVRPNTERPITVLEGTNRLCKPEEIEEHIKLMLSSEYINGDPPLLWDGKTAKRIVRSIMEFLKL